MDCREGTASQRYAHEPHMLMHNVISVGWHQLGWQNHERDRHAGGDECSDLNLHDF
jgi:hypothetical protein